MIHKRVSIESLQKHPSFEELIKETSDDRLKYVEGLEIINQSQLYSLMEGDIMIGFFSIDDLGDCVEAHAYIFKDHRRHSLKALRYMKSIQTKNIKTSVYGTHPHVVRFLIKLGFIVTGTVTDALVMKGETYDVWELYYTKENNNG